MVYACPVMGTIVGGSVGIRGIVIVVLATITGSGLGVVD